jgi:hypothetical protein
MALFDSSSELQASAPGASAPGASGDPLLFCNRCWRKETHYLAVKAHGRRAHRFWRFGTLGLIELFGSFRCRCCGNKRYLRFDLFAPETRRVGLFTRKTRSKHSRPRKQSRNLRR